MHWDSKDLASYGVRMMKPAFTLENWCYGLYPGVYITPFTSIGLLDALRIAPRTRFLYNATGIDLELSQVTPFRAPCEA
jgi:hypothetical protein